MAEGLSANLDLLRAIAVILVLLQHLCRRTGIDQIGWVPTSSLGYFGVLLFFVHTSLVLMYSLERTKLTGWRLFKNFYVRRIFRIFPASLITVSAALLLHLDSDINGIRGLSHGQLPGRLTIIANLLLIQNLVYVKSIVNVLWSLPFELQMYIFLPLLFLWIRRDSRGWSLIALWIVSGVAGFVQPHMHALGRMSILQFVPNFLPGVIAYALPHTPRVNSYLWPIFILCLIVAFTIFPNPIMGWALCLILGLSVPWFYEIRAPWLRQISNRVATYSYGIYLSHQFVIWVAFGLLGSRSIWLRMSAMIGLLVIVPIALYHAVERPMIRVGGTLAKERSVTGVGQTASGISS